MVTPLTSWRCDVCGELIATAEQGYVIWRDNGHGRAHDFKVIHQNKCDRSSTYPSSRALEDFLGADGAANLMAFLSLGTIKKNLGQPSYCQIADMDEFVDLFRRFQTPYYEEARVHFFNPNLLQDFDDSNEVYPYLEGPLKTIIDRY